MLGGEALQPEWPVLLPLNYSGNGQWWVWHIWKLNLHLVDSQQEVVVSEPCGQKVKIFPLSFLVLACLGMMRPSCVLHSFQKVICAIGCQSPIYEDFVHFVMKASHFRPLMHTMTVILRCEGKYDLC